MSEHRSTDRIPRIAFFGSPALAAECLSELLKRFRVAAAVTQPDKASGRGRALRPTPVASLASREKIPLYKPPAVGKDFAEAIAGHGVSLVVVAAYGKLLPQELLECAERGAVNLHASLLPKYRGASPVQAAILNGETRSGVTVQKMVREMDAGDILRAAEIRIAPEWTAEDLMREVTRVGPRLLADTVEEYLEGSIAAVPQREEEATFCSIIRKNDARVDWDEDAELIARKIRAYNLWPVCHSYLEGRLVRFFDARARETGVAGVRSAGETLTEGAGPAPAGGVAGTVEALDKREGIVVRAGRGSVGITELQLENRTRMGHRDFANGYRDLLGKRFLSHE